MPTLCFSEVFTAKEKTILTKTFKQNCRDLGLTDFDATIQVRKARLESAGCMTFIHDCFLVILNSAGTLSDWIFTLGHELVHVRQYRTGQLRDDRETGGTYWGTTHVPALYCNSRKYYHMLPWEIEAHSLDGKLFENARRVL